MYQKLFILLSYAKYIGINAKNIFALLDGIQQELLETWEHSSEPKLSCLDLFNDSQLHILVQSRFHLAFPVVGYQNGCVHSYWVCGFLEDYV